MHDASSTYAVHVGQPFVALVMFHRSMQYGPTLACGLHHAQGFPYGDVELPQSDAVVSVVQLGHASFQLSDDVQ